MAISKRLRYEIFRRDNHTCRYCGRSAPEVVLHVDHVIPQALGGAEKDPSNLVTSCSECNGGKSASSPDQAVVADVSESAAKWKAAIAQAADEARTNDSGRDALYEAVIQAWPSFHRKKLPGDFTETVDQFVDAGLPNEAIIEMAQLAGAKPSIYNRWAYFCGCCWTKIRQLQDRALEIADSTSNEKQDLYQITTSVADPDGELITAIAFYDRLRCPIQPDSWDCLCFPDATRWIFSEVLKCQKQYPCNDPICVAQYGQYVWDNTLSQRRLELRDDDLMDAADELELVH